MSAGIKSYQESTRLKSSVNEEPSAGFRKRKRDAKESDERMSAVLRAENISSVKVNPSGLKGLTNQKLERRLKGIESNYEESAPKVSIKTLGDFKIYERLSYHRPFRVLFDALFLEGYLLREGNYAVETIEDLVGGPCIFLFTNCVLRNITQKRLGTCMTDLTTEEYHCKDAIDYLRTDFDCLKEVIKQDGISERLILATGDQKLKRLMRKISAVPILYLSNHEKPGELLFELHHEERNIMDMLKTGDLKDSASETVKVFIDGGFIRCLLQIRQVSLDKEFIKEFIGHISKLLGRQVALFTTRCASNNVLPDPHIGCASNHEVPYPDIAFVMCGHPKRRKSSDACVMSVVEKPQYGISYVATTSESLMEMLSKMRFVAIISFQGRKLILNEPKACVESVAFDIEETTEEDTLTSISKEKLTGRPVFRIKARKNKVVFKRLRAREILQRNMKKAKRTVRKPTANGNSGTGKKRG